MSHTPTHRRSDDVIASGPSVTGQPTERAPIGVPIGYTTPRYANQVEINAPIVQTPPRYYEGDEWLPSQWRMGQVADLQRALEASGVIPQGASYRVGVYDDTTRNAFTRLLGFANGAGITYTQAITRWAEGTETKEAGPLPTPVINLSNPEDLKAAFSEVARKRLGYGRIDEGAMNRMVRAYQQEESAWQMNRASTTGGTAVEPPSVETFADAAARELDPTAYDAHKVLEAWDMIARLLRGNALGVHRDVTSL